MNCALCQTPFSPAELSHIVPKFAYRWLKKSSATGYLRFQGAINRRVQDGIKDHFLCPACEDRFQGDETEFANKIFHPFVANNNHTVKYGEYHLRFATSISWRVLAYLKHQERLSHLRGRHLEALSEALDFWRSYLLGEREDIGCHEIHLIPFPGVVDYSGNDLPQNINRYLRRSIDIDVGVSDYEAFTYCKLGPLIYIGIIYYPKLWHWKQTRVSSDGTFGPSEFVAPSQYQEFIFSRSRRMMETEASISQNQLDMIEATYNSREETALASDTYHSTKLDIELNPEQPNKRVE